MISNLNKGLLNSSDRLVAFYMGHCIKVNENVY